MFLFSALYPPQKKCFELKRVRNIRYHRMKNVTLPEATAYVAWLEKGVFDALQRKYLHMAHLEIFAYRGTKQPSDPRSKIILATTGAGPLLETYTFTVSYGNKGPEFHLLPDSLAEQPAYTSQTPDSITEKTAGVIETLINMTSTLRPLPPKCLLSMKVSSHLTLTITPNHAKRVLAQHR